MLKNILNLEGAQELSKNEQKMTLGGGSGNGFCPTYPASQCSNCGGFPLPNGCCLGTNETHCCLTGNCK